MRSIITFFISGSLCCLILLFMVDVFLPEGSIAQKFSDQAIALLGVSGAIVAAVATWQAAKEAARSAKIARESMEQSAESARQTLAETQRFNRRSNFENRYALLLAQHNNYHDQVCRLT
ncbi:hypothetical protein DA718_25420 [Klebsiella huaxiensis]|uniref:Uncharacterized protein n=1 Tax=Klebsiella huaxiensis TaxID=2153354 RepID=A0ABT6E6T8_9ENTR|nr:hypothetical protein [Klebsiella huaxiensis]MDG1641110.1 hypothetical protein [Klebsiella huaxiensis]QBG10269.1 hypothetical protein DA718_25420 [Klebsiella huaxiensis]